MAVWRSIGIIEDEGAPKVLQQKMFPKRQKMRPRDEHRVVPVTDLDGVDAEQLVDSLADSQREVGETADSQSESDSLDTDLDVIT